MQKGWQEVNGTWYYFDDDGIMVTGWQEMDTNVWYYFNPDTGGMISNTTIYDDGAYWAFDENGVCTGKVGE